MTNLAFLWHIHQPPADESMHHYLSEAEKKSYNVIFDYCLSKHPDAKICFNITGVTLELLEKYHPHIVKKLRERVLSGNSEVTCSAYFHPILALIPPDEARMQIEMNIEICKRLLGKKPFGFFPPEMGWSSYLIPILKDLGLKWVILDENLFKKSDTMLNEDWLYRTVYLEGPNSKIIGVPRCKPISQGLWAASVGGFSTDDFMNFLRRFGPHNFLVSSTDAELLGLHWFHGPGYFNELLWKIKEDPNINLTLISDYLEKNPPNRSMFVEAGTWAHDYGYYIWKDHPDDVTQDIITNRARMKIESAQNFILLCEKLGGNSKKAREYLNKAWRHLFLADMSDSRGWDPAPVRIKYGYENGLKAIEFAERAIREAIENIKR